MQPDTSSATLPSHIMDGGPNNVCTVCIKREEDKIQNRTKRAEKKRKSEEVPLDEIVNKATNFLKFLEKKDRSTMLNNSDTPTATKYMNTLSKLKEIIQIDIGRAHGVSSSEVDVLM